LFSCQEKTWRDFSPPAGANFFFEKIKKALQVFTRLKLKD